MRTSEGKAQHMKVAYSKYKWVKSKNLFCELKINSDILKYKMKLPGQLVSWGGFSNKVEIPLNVIYGFRVDRGWLAMKRLTLYIYNENAIRGNKQLRIIKPLNVGILTSQSKKDLLEIVSRYAEWNQSHGLTHEHWFVPFNADDVA